MEIGKGRQKKEEETKGTGRRRTGRNTGGRESQKKKIQDETAEDRALGDLRWVRGKSHPRPCYTVGSEHSRLLSPLL